MVLLVLQIMLEGVQVDGSLPPAAKKSEQATQAIALTQNLSELGRKVLLIEGDIRRRTFNEYFKANAKGGLSALIATHNLDLAARMDRVVRLDAGRVVTA